MHTCFLRTCLAPMRRYRAATCALMIGVALPFASVQAAPNLPNPVMFVTQVPVPADFATIGSVFANHMAGMQDAARGGDLWIRYANGNLRNLTAEAGYGMNGQQGANAIAVRDPAIHFNGSKAIFSMVIGAPTQQYQQITRYWQLYEITGFGVGQTISITHVPGQPEDTNNVESTYASDGSIIFVSDRPRNGQRHLYPQLDEYESTPTPTGLWNLNPASGALRLLQHSPSGSFRPIVDSYGRIIFTRWDHLQRDQQADAGTYGAFNWVSEAANAATTGPSEVFPEPRAETATTYGFTINHFFPWQLNQDGSAEETLNHIGRHELFDYFAQSLKNDPNLVEYIYGASPPRNNALDVLNWLQIKEDPTTPGRYFAIDAPEFYTHASGQIIAINGSPTTNPDNMLVAYKTPRSTSSFYAGTPPADFTGYLFRLYGLVTGNGGYLQRDANGALTNGISKSVSWWDPDVLVTYNGPLWELSPVEVRARNVPPNTGNLPPEAPEAQAFSSANVDFAAFQAFLAARGLGVLVSRNVTTRDRADQQQPYNLRVPGGVQSIATGGAVYDITHMQFLQGDQIRGLGGAATPNDGRRVLAQPLHDPNALQWMPPPAPGTPAGAVPIASDGSVAAIVPAQRALAWQSTSSNGTPVVRERYWISVKPGEVRACGGCHGVNTADQTGQVPATNMPLALVNLLNYWQANADVIFADDFE